MGKYINYKLRIHTGIKSKKYPNGVVILPINQNKKALELLENSYKHGKNGFIVLEGRPDGYEPMFDNMVYDGVTEHALYGNTVYSRPRVFREWLKEYLI
jgi:hypothetical protein